MVATAGDDPHHPDAMVAQGRMIHSTEERVRRYAGIGVTAGSVLAFAFGLPYGRDFALLSVGVAGGLGLYRSGVESH